MTEPLRLGRVFFSGEIGESSDISRKDLGSKEGMRKNFLRGLTIQPERVFQNGKFIEIKTFYYKARATRIITAHRILYFFAPGL